MENNRGQSIFLSVVGIATLLVAIVGATFAYFSINVTGNEAASSINVTAAVVGGVTFTDGADITATNVYPGWSTEKTFTVAQTQATTEDIQYYISLVVGKNDFSAAHASDLVYSLVDGGATAYAGGGTLVTASNQNLPAEGTTQIGGATTFGTLKGGAAADSHTYKLKVLFKELGTEQNYAQGYNIEFSIRVDVKANQGLRTEDTGNTGFTLWTTGTTETSIP